MDLRPRVVYVAAQEFLDDEDEGPIFRWPNDTIHYAFGMIGGHHLVIAAGQVVNAEQLLLPA